MRGFTARLVVFGGALVTFAATVLIAAGHFWLGYGVLALATFGALNATAYVPDYGLRYGVIFATLAYGNVSGNKPLGGGLTARHFAAFVVATLMARAFVGLQLRRNGAERELPEGAGSRRP